MATNVRPVSRKLRDFKAGIWSSSPTCLWQEYFQAKQQPVWKIYVTPSCLWAALPKKIEESV